MPNPNEVRCPSCDCLFGVQHGGKLNIKHRELYRTVNGGEVSGPCRRCGEMVFWPPRLTVAKGS